jgi:hypothetical protein
LIELAAAILESPAYAKILPSDLGQIRDRALVTQHGEEAITELQELEAGIAIADDVVTVARQEVGFDCGGLAKLNEAAAPFEKLVIAPWLKKFDENGVETVKVFKMIGAGPFDGPLA